MQTTCCDCARDGSVASIPCRAVHHLWCVYHDWAGTEGFELSACWGIPIKRYASKKRFQAGLFATKETRGGSTMALPEVVPHDYSAREGLLIYHELAHHILRVNDPFFQHKTRWTPTEYDVQEEAWCDNFALAMLLAFFGWEPFGLMRQGHAFLRYGERIAKPRNDILFAYRLRREMRKPRKRNILAPTPLYLLANDLLAHADSKNE